MPPFDDHETSGTPPGSLSWPERIENYRRVFQREPYLTYVPGVRPWLYGMWVQAHYARCKAAREADFHGAYPGDYLRRIAALFPDLLADVLHLFSGMVDLAAMPGDTLDIRPMLSPTYCCNAETLEGVPLERYRLVLPDPPYTPADATEYGTEMPVASRVMVALERLQPGAYVVWLDERTPGYSKATFVHEGIIGLTTSAEHRFRVISIFRRI